MSCLASQPLTSLCYLAAGRCADDSRSVWYGTNEFNFEKLPNPPEFEPTHCRKCNRVIKLGEDGYSVRGKEYLCANCSAKECGRSSR